VREIFSNERRVVNSVKCREDVKSENRKVSGVDLCMLVYVHMCVCVHLHTKECLLMFRKTYDVTENLFCIRNCAINSTNIVSFHGFMIE
jgi:hypothetical protein